MNKWKKAAVVTKFGSAMTAAAIEAEAKRVDRTFLQYKMEEKAINAHRVQAIAAVEKKLASKHSSNLKMITPDDIVEGEKAVADLLAAVENQISVGVTEEDIRETKRQYIAEVEKIRALRSPNLFGKTSTEPSASDRSPSPSREERYEKAVEAAAKAAEAQRIDRTYVQMRLEETAIAAEKGALEAAAEKKVATKLYIDGVTFARSPQVLAAEGDVADLVAQIEGMDRELELHRLGAGPPGQRLTAEEVLDNQRPLKRSYITAVIALRKERAPHLYSAKDLRKVGPNGTPQSSVSRSMGAGPEATFTDDASHQDSSEASSIGQVGGEYVEDLEDQDVEPQEQVDESYRVLGLDVATPRPPLE